MASIAKSVCTGGTCLYWFQHNDIKFCFSLRSSGQSESAALFWLCSGKGPGIVAAAGLIRVDQHAILIAGIILLYGCWKSSRDRYDSQGRMFTSVE